MLRLALKYPSHGITRRYGNSRLVAVRFLQSQKCAPEPTKPQKEKESGGRGTGFFYTLGFISFATGATIAYARYDPEFRQWLAKQVPWTNSVIAVIFQEKETWGELIMKILHSMQQKTWKAVFGHKKEEKRALKREGDLCEDIKEKNEYTPPLSTPEPSEKSSSEIAPRSVFSALLTNTEQPEENWAEIRLLPEPSLRGSAPVTTIVSGEKKERNLEDDPDNLPETHPKHLVELEKKIGDAAATAITAYDEAVCAVREYNREMLQIVERTVERSDEKLWNNLKLKADRKEILVKSSEEKAEAALGKVNRLKDIIQDSKFEAPEQLKATAMRNIVRVIDEIGKAQSELAVEKQNACITDKYWKKVEEARRHYIEELHILFPEIRVGDREWNIASHELDLFLVYCFQNVLFYQKELARLQILADERLQTILRSSGEKIDKHLVQATVTNEIDKEKRMLEVEFQKRILDLKKETEKDLRHQLRRQAEVHRDQLCDAVSLREKELEREHLRRENEKIASEQDKFKYLLSGMVGRLQGLESALKARASVDKSAHRAQVLWSACQALYSAIKSGEPGIPWDEQMRPLVVEVTAIKNAALEEDELVQAVIGGIPDEALSRGVLPENALKERFLKVERVARRVALVSEDGASLPVYALSYLQSLLLLQAINPIPQAEIRDEPMEFSCLDTYDILQRARYWMDRGNIDQTLRYMNLLKGAPRLVASDWMKEARILLETKQAANALMAHASAAGLLYL